MSSGIPGQGKSYPYWAANYGDNGGGSSGSSSPIGSISMWASTVEPPFYKFCNGQNLLISQYNSLYNAIGNTFSSGKTTPSGIFCQTYQIQDNVINLDSGPAQVNYSIAPGDIVRATDFTKTGGNNNINGYTFTVISAPAINAVGGIFVLDAGPLSGTTGDGTYGNLTRICFNVPNISNMGVRGTNPYALGDMSGNDTYQLLAENLPQHRHGVLQGGSINILSSGSIGVQGATPNVDGGTRTIQGATYLEDGSTQVANDPFSIMNRFIALNFIIRAE